MQASTRLSIPLGEAAHGSGNFSGRNWLLGDMDLELTNCPECGAPAEVIDRFVLPSSDGPVEHVKTRCVTGPWFVVPAGRRRNR
jgi:hypothetical protein